MIKHVVVLTWLPEASEEQKRQVADGLATLPPLMKGMRSYQFGPDLGLTPGTGDFAIVAEFDDQDSYEAYRDHPAHQEVIKQTIGPILHQRVGAQFEI